jgi:GNAT superfamily N-acetyltransferase
MRVRRLYPMLQSEKQELVGLLVSSFSDLCPSLARNVLDTNLDRTRWYEARHGGVCVGTCAVTDGLLSDLCVLPSMRHQGVARKMLAYIVRDNHGVQCVARVLPPYQSFYEAVRWGFTSRHQVADGAERVQWELDYPTAAWMAPR